MRVFFLLVAILNYPELKAGSRPARPYSKGRAYSKRQTRSKGKSEDGGSFGDESAPNERMQQRPLSEFLIVPRVPTPALADDDTRSAEHHEREPNL